ncbi:MAG: PhoX family phosphatase [Woeseiaceae bacterium]|nr:PhoX family phosphatase [Woeseiaceae bacterium]
MRIDESEDTTSNPRIAEGERTMREIIEIRLTRRAFLGGLTTTTLGLALGGCATSKESAPPNAGLVDFGFEEIRRGLDSTHHVPTGYTADVLLRWGDPLFEDSPPFDPTRQSEAAQLRQFGYNNDYLGFVALPADGAGRARGLLCVNHEYVSTFLMFPNVAQQYPDSMSADLCLTEMAAHGGSVVEIVETTDGWRPVVVSRYTRRITAHRTPMEISGPAAGSPRLITRDDPTGRVAVGTLNNCAGGITPWGTWLMAEENFNYYFLGAPPDDHPESENHKRYGVPAGLFQWGRHFDRYDLSREPNEPNRYGWVVEVDPMDPASTPKKRTALGRFKHEGAESVIAPDGRLVIYMGDDQRFDYVYKFVSDARVDTEYPTANTDLLDSGTLYVARFDVDGSVEWLPIVHGLGPLTANNGFATQADVLIETRRAADLLGATPMDRPEDVEPDPRTGSVWVMLTNNHKRTVEQVNAANPRARNRFGHVVQIVEPDGDFASTRSRWDILVKCGDPDDPTVGADWNPLTSENGWFGSPDNCAIDPSGRLWIATDGNEETGAADGLWAMATAGDRRGTGKAFFRAPAGAEVCGPKFTPDGRSLFLAVQHPGDGNGATFEAPRTRWPDFEEGMPPRPSVIAIRRRA